MLTGGKILPGLSRAQDSYRQNFNGYTRVFEIHLFNGVVDDITGSRVIPEIDMAAAQTGSYQISICMTAINKYATVTPLTNGHSTCLHKPLLAVPPQCGPAIVMVRVVRQSVCHTRVFPKLSEIDIWLLGNRAFRFRICHQIRDQKYSYAILGVSGSTLLPFRQKWAGWPSECTEWITGNSHQSAPHWEPRRASYRHVL